MKNKKGFMSKFYTGKGFYLTSAVCLCLIAAAIGVIYRASSNLITEIAYDGDKTEYMITEQAEADKRDEEDPRFTNEDTTAPKESTTEEELTQENTTVKATTQPPTTQTEATTTEVQVANYGNTAYILPVTEDILKDYSETPVYDETMGDWRVHKAIDFQCEKGTPVYAVGNGKVTKVYSDTSYGYCIEIDFGEFTGRYCGLEQGTTVKLDSEIKKGDLVGNTGDLPCENEQENHFHFETLRDGKSVDPLAALKK